MAKYKELKENGVLIGYRLSHLDGGTIRVNEDNSYSKELDLWLTQTDPVTGKLNQPDPANIPDPMIAVRAKRDQLLIQSDIEFNKLDDKGLSTTKIKADRVALRDLPTSQPAANIDTVDWTFLKVLKV